MNALAKIVRARGGVLLAGGRRALIPGPGHSVYDRSVSLALTEDGRMLIHCFSPRDDWRSVRDDLKQDGLIGDTDGHAVTPRERAQHAPLPQSSDRRERALKWWHDARPVRGTPAEAYLRKRAVLDAPDEALRFHPAVTSVDDREKRPALIAAITGETGELQGVQLTLLTSHGARKATIATPRRIVGALNAGAVRLWPAAETLVVAEGVETALSASNAFDLPSWAALSAQNLAAFQPPAIVQRLIIAADADGPGLDAAHVLAQRLPLEVFIEAPPANFNDWNDWARARAEVRF